MQSIGERRTRQMKSARADSADGGLNPELQVTLPSTPWVVGPGLGPRDGAVVADRAAAGDDDGRRPERRDAPERA